MISEWLLVETIIVLIALGITSGVISSYMTVRKLSLLGDVMSHASFPGIALAFLVTHSSSSGVLLLGGTVSALLSVLSAQWLKKYLPSYKDTSMGIVLSLFFAVGLLLIGVIQKQSISGQSILNNYIFGNIYAVTRYDALLITAISIILFLLFIVLWRYHKVLSYDEEHAHMISRYTGLIDFVITFMAATTVVLGLQTVGILLMSALIIAPGACAQMMNCKSYVHFTICSVSISLLSVLSGLALTLLYPKLPTGSTIVFISASICIFIALYKAFTGSKKRNVSKWQ